MILETEGANQIIEEFTKAHTVKEWLNIAVKTGILIIIIVYIKIILRTLVSILKAIAGVFLGKDGKLDSKELMGATCWLVIGGCAIKYFNTSKYDLDFIILFAGFYCTMFGIEGFNSLIEKRNETKKTE